MCRDRWSYLPGISVPDYVPYAFDLETRTFSAFGSLIRSVFAKQSFDEE
jgi:hypothetical protein